MYDRFPRVTAPSARDPNDGLAALERLYAKKVVTLEEAQAAAKLLTGDPNAVFPPPKPPPAPPAAPAPAATAPAAAPEPAPAAEAAPEPAPAPADSSSESAPSG